jgi:hypothetical protein
MMTVAEIKQAILDLPRVEYVEIVEWLRELEEEEWDRQIEADAKAGKVAAMTKPMRIRDGRGTAYYKENVR